MKKIALELSDYDYARLKRQKELDGYPDKSWGEWLLTKGHQRFNPTDMDVISKGNVVMRKLWNNNIGFNLGYIRRKGVKSLRELAKTQPSGSVVVVGAGPSIWSHNHLDTLKAYKGTIVCCDRMLKPLLEKGVVPNYVVTVDGSELIIPFYKNKLFKEHVKDVKVLLHITANPKLTKFLYGIKADVHWFICHTKGFVAPEDDVMHVIYMTQTEHNPDGLQTIMGGGNVGVTAWCFSFVVLKANPVVLVGFDMGYPDGTPLGNTYYFSGPYKQLKERGVKSSVAALATHQMYQKEYNPDQKCWTYTDLVFREYRNIFMSYLQNAPSNLITINSTEGGALHGPRLLPMSLKEAIEKYVSYGS